MTGLCPVFVDVDARDAGVIHPAQPAGASASASGAGSSWRYSADSDARGTTPGQRRQQRWHESRYASVAGERRVSAPLCWS